MSEMWDIQIRILKFGHGKYEINDRERNQRQAGHTDQFEFKQSFFNIYFITAFIPRLV